MIAKYPRPNVNAVIGMNFPIPPNFLIFTSSFIPCITEPAPRNMLALKNPCVNKCMIANA